MDANIETRLFTFPVVVEVPKTVSKAEVLDFLERAFSIEIDENEATPSNEWLDLWAEFEHLKGKRGD